MVQQLIQEFSEMLLSGEITPFELIQGGVSPDLLEKIQEYTERLRFLRIRKKATTRLADFILYTKEDYDMNWHHEVICDEIDDFLLPTNDKTILILQAPPRSGKTEIVSRRLPPYLLGKNPDLGVVFATYAADLAKKINRDTQRVLDSPSYRSIFPETTLSGSALRGSASGTYVRTTEMYEVVNRTGSFKSVGVGGALTGFGFNVGIIDDVVKGMKEAMSSTVSESIWEWYQSVFFTRRAPGAKIIIMMTRWAEHDLIGRVIKEAEKNGLKYDILSFPMTYEENAEHDNVLDIRTDEGEVLWENRFDDKFCEETKMAVGSKVWAGLYQQRPSPAGGAIFQRAWYKFYTELPDFDYTFVSLDAAFKDSQASDFVVFGVWGVKGKNKYLIDLVRDRMSFTNTVSTIYLLLAKYRGLTELVIEDKANGSAIIDTLDNDPRISIPIIPYSPKESKESRAASIAPQVEAGQVFLPNTDYEPNANKTWVFDFIEETIAFPNAKNDDQVDMMSQALIRISKSTAGWLEGIMAKGASETPNAHVDDRIKFLSDRMGWDVFTPGGKGVGLDF